MSNPSKTRTVVVCSIVLGVGVAGVWILNENKSTPTKVPRTVTRPVVLSQVVRSATRRIDVKTQGTVKPRTEIELVAQVSGEVKSVSPSLVNGGFFAKAEVLVQLDDRDYQLDVIQAESLVAQADLRVSREVAEAEIARKEWKSLGKGEATPLTLREPQLQEARAALAAAKAGLRKAQLSLERTTVKAPFAGRVRVKGVDVGQFVGVGTSLAKVYAVDYAEVRLPLHDSKLRYLDVPLTYQGSGSTRTGPKVTLRVRFAQRVHEWPARIVRTEGELDAKSRMVHAIARVENPYAKVDSDRPPLSVGMFVEAVIRGREFPNVVEIPRASVREGDEVLLIDKDNRLHRRRVKILHRDGKKVLVESGLFDGERICISPISIFVEGMEVEVRKPQSAADATRNKAGGPR